MKWTPWIRVVETNLVPKTRIAGNLFIATEEARTEPIAGRIIEVPENEEQAETYRNPHSGFVAYVPVGSIKKGKDLVTTGGMKIVGNKIVQGKTTACGTCHGRGSHGRGRCAADRRPVAELHGPADVGHATGDAERRVGAADEAGRGEPHRRRHGGHRRLRHVASAAWRGQPREAGFEHRLAPRYTSVPGSRSTGRRRFNASGHTGAR